MPLSWVEIDLAALRHNYFQARSLVSADTRVIGVVKSDAYGHGMIPVARELVGCGAHLLAVSKYWEARELRSGGIDAPILVLLGVEPAEMEDAIRDEVRPVLFRMDHAKLLSQASCRLNRVARVHLKVDTGMGRLGVACHEMPGFLNKLTTLPGIEVEGILSHFAAADEADKSYCDCQLERFQDCVRAFSERNRPLLYAHIANSAGLLNLPGAHFALVRPGIMLYGSKPSRDTHHADLRPVMSFKTRIVQLKQVEAGQPIGYGRTYVANRPSLIATLPVGYDDGYSRLLSNRGKVLVRGMRAPIVGRVSMNMITVDVTDVPGVSEDDEVVLLGAQGEDRITAEEIAELCGTISYEVYCNMGRHRFKYFLHPAA
jgi:alanine racemase